MKTLKRIISTILLIIILITSTITNAVCEIFDTSIKVYAVNDEMVYGTPYADNIGDTNYKFILPVKHLKEVPEDYIGIYTAKDLDLLRLDLNGKFILMNNLDMSAYSQFKPIGTVETPFTGTIDGNGYEISNLNIISYSHEKNYDIDKYGALIAVANKCNVKNLIVNNGSNSIRYTPEYDGDIFAATFIAYDYSSVIENCSNYMNVEAYNGARYYERNNSYVGAFIGKGEKSTVKNSYNFGQMISHSENRAYAAGIIGFANSCNIEACYNDAPIFATSDNSSVAGGISGVFSGLISKSYNRGLICADALDNTQVSCLAGGIVSSFEGYQANYSMITDCFNIGKVIARANYLANYLQSCLAGGLYAYSSSGFRKVMRCYNNADILEISNPDEDYSHSIDTIASPINANDNYDHFYKTTAEFSLCFSVDDEGKYPSKYSYTTLTSEQAKNELSYSNDYSASFDFENVWQINPSGDYPFPTLKILPINSVPNANISFNREQYKVYNNTSYIMDNTEISGLINLNAISDTTVTKDDITISTSNDCVDILDFSLSENSNSSILSNFKVDIKAKKLGKCELTVTLSNGNSTTCIIDVVEAKSKLKIEYETDESNYKFINGSFYNKSGEKVDTINASINITNCLENGTAPELGEIVEESLKIDNIFIQGITISGFYFNQECTDDIQEAEIASINYGETKKINKLVYVDGKEIDEWNLGYSKQNYSYLYTYTYWDNNYNKETQSYIDPNKYEEHSFEIDFSYSLKLEEDDFCFVNSQDYFVGTDEKDAYLISNEAKKMIKWYDFVDISINSAFNWNGSCLGMSGMKSLFNNETISVLSFGDSSTYTLNAPVKDGKVSNLKLRDAINIIQSSQTLIPTVAATINFKSQDALCEELVEAVRNIENGGILPVVIIEKPGFAAGAHAVVAYNIIDKGDNFEIYISDPNFFGMTKMTISKDYKNFKYHDGTYTKVKAIITDPDIININNIAPGLVNSEISTFSNVPLSGNNTQEKYDFTVINIQGANEITVKNQKGESAIINFADETISGTLAVLDVSSVPSGDGLTRIVIGDSSNEVNTYEIACDVDAYTMTVNNNHIGASVCVEDATDSMVSFRTDGKIALDSENDINYDVALFYFNAVSDVYSANLAGKSKNIAIKYHEDGIVAEADNLSEQELSVNHYDDNLTKENIEILRFAETDSVLIAEENNSIVLYEDIEDDGYYDNFVSGTIFEYNLLEDGTIEISGIAGGNSLENIIIPECYDGYIVSGIAKNCFKGNTLLSSVEISDTVTSIGEGAFRDCSNLTSVVLPNNLSLMSNMLFYGCTNLRTVTIPESVTQIGSYAFAYCSSISNISMPDSVTDIGDYVFLNCEKMANVKLSNKLKTIRGFNGCSNLASIEIPDGVLTITSYAFSGCASLQSITLPASLTSVHPMSFYECSSLTSIDVDSKNVTFCSIDGVLFSMDKTQLICYPNGKADMYYEIPSSVSVIGDYAFEYNNNLINVTIPDGITSIGYNAFSCCKKLESIVIPSTIKVIKDTAFYHCESLSKVVILGEISDIPQSCFSGCTSLKNVTLPNSVVQIKAAAFYECRNLTEITIGSNVESIGEKAFQKCVNLNTIYNCSSINIKKNSSNYGYVGYYADNIYEHKMNSSEVPPSCEENGYTLHKCVLCEYSYTNNLVSSTGHKDDNGDYICDYGCGHEFEKPIEPEQPDAPDEPSDDDCGHLCHKSGFMGFIWKIVRFFWKLFKMNPICECGVAHY